MVDGYGNIFAPLLPLLIPKLHLSLAAAGTLTMLYQMAASVAQVGFGHIADRWRPRLLVMAGPVVAVDGAQLRRARAIVPGARRGADRRAASAPPRFIRRPRRSRIGSAALIAAWRCRCTSPAARWGFRWGRCSSRRPRSISASQWTPLLAIPGLIVIAFFLTRVPPIPLHHDGAGGFRALRPYARPLSLLYVIVVLRTLTSLAFATFVPVMLTRRGLSVSAGRRDRRGVSVRQRRRRIPRRAGGRSVRTAPGDRLVAACCRRRSCSPRRCCRAGRSSSCWRSAASSCSRRCPSTSSSARRWRRSAPRRCRR